MSLPSLELWGGIECTVNRVKDAFHDQLDFSGHRRRGSDLEQLASLGIGTLRYPVLWEHVAARGAQQDWSWADERLPRLRELGIEPIAGLLHHGSGPAHTSLLHANFADELASYAGAVARRYPHLRRFTPVNEPLTTARFSGLYGHWYPHAREDRAFVRALLNEVRGTALAMRAIRREIPEAQLVHTEDLGHVRSTRDLAYQAEFENERRFLGLDLLYGRVDCHHPFYEYLLESGASQRELAWFRENPCIPNVLGFNYYVTGERFLDSRVALYPADRVGGNGYQRYADVEAVRVCRSGLVGPAALLEEAYLRYHTPLAITEAHMAGPPEEQARWFSFLWSEAQAARARGVQVQAVTAWALLGSYGWAELVTRGAGSYEPGAFRIEGDRLVKTPYADFLRAVAQGAPQLAHGGWWHSDERLLYPEPEQELDVAISDLSVAGEE